MIQETYRSGVVAIVGPPNAGKSTLLNQLLGQKIAIVSNKPQTTRNRILGIVTGDSHQMIVLDTPGLHQARDMINQEMVRVALESLAEADVVLFMDDCAKMNAKLLAKRIEEYQEYFGHIKAPSLLALNKIDLVKPEQLLPLTREYSQLHAFEAVLPISALTGDGVELLVEEIVRRLPEGPQYYPDDIPTDASERFIVGEIIREKVFQLAKEEVPYSTAVVIDSFEESDDQRPVVIHATIVVERSSQKGIMIGHRGQMLAQIRKKACHDIEQLLGCKVRLQLWVKVRKNWTNNEHILREYGLS
ncbi:GTPase Era [Desulfogranum mediterraneum]|uniref:GTPase Era n=1 Tax=Desulfogranum mediterraneum TaxID=160661 RepID=UPI0003F881D5|nr:GTPase Era [Desulfogranum mediterraneum]